MIEELTWKRVLSVWLLWKNETQEHGGSLRPSPFRRGQWEPVQAGPFWSTHTSPAHPPAQSILSGDPSSFTVGSWSLRGAWHMEGAR